MKGMSRVAAFALATLIASTAIAEDYTFEISAGYDRTQSDSFLRIVDQPPFAPGSFESLTSGDTDSFDLVGNWYFKGLSDDEGPRSRALLVDRASVLSLSYRRADGSAVNTVNSTVPGFPSSQGRTSSSVDEVGFSGRLVGRRNGWFIQGGVLEGDLDADIEGSAIIVGDRSAWSVGFGRYIFKNTTLALGYGEAEVGFSDLETIGLDFEHLGSLPGTWQYGVDLSYQRLEDDFSDFNTWELALALYPTRDIEFGVAYADRLEPATFTPGEVESFEGFVSWFVKPNIEISARYRVDDFGDSFGNFGDDDQDNFGLSLNVRF